MLTSYKDRGGVFQAAARAVLREWEETLYYAPSNELLKVSSFVQHVQRHEIQVPVRSRAKRGLRKSAMPDVNIFPLFSAL